MSIPPTPGWKIFLWAASIPFVVGITYIFSPGLGFLLLLLSLIAVPALAIIGAIASVSRGREMQSAKNSGAANIWAIFAGPVMAIFVLAASLPLHREGRHLGNLLSLAINHSTFEAIIRAAEKSSEEQWYAEQEGITYSVDPGPPVRVAFNPSGMLDNWSAIIHDPTGDMLLADGFDSETGEFVAPDRITKLFEGDLVECRRLVGDYLSCAFT